VVNQRWVFVVRALDRPGTLTAAAAVFSNRGVSLEGILGSGIAPNTVENGRLLFSFRATEPKQALLKKALERLSSVFQVEAYHYDDERLRAIAVAKLSQSAKLTQDDEGYFVETIAQTACDRVVMLTGSPRAVDDAVAQFRQQGHLKDVVMTYIAV
jgi:acetolactate synthase small subunit